MSVSSFQRNRRIFGRQRPRGKVRTTCHAGSVLGPNLAVALLDVSETGARLRTKTLAKGKQVTISLEGREHARPISCAGTVLRCEEETPGLCQIAVLWEKRLPFADILKITS